MYNWNHALVGFVLSLLLVGQACAQPTSSYPSKPVTVIVAFPAGGTSDVLARTVGERLSAAWRQPVLVENRPGASGNIAATAVAQAAPDGYTLLLSAAAISVAPALYKNPGFRLFDDLVPITVIGTVSFMLVTSPTLPVSSFAEFLRYAANNPNKLSMGSGGNGTITHLAGELMKMRARVEFTHVPYKGGIQGMTDLLGGRIDFTIDGGPILVPHIATQKLRLLAVTSAQRLPQYPAVPTVAESGYPGFQASAWQMVLAPAGTPKSIVEKIQSDIALAIRDPALADRLIKMGVEPIGDTPEASGTFLRSEITKWADVVRQSGAKID